jgi:hypothetical protein
MTHHYKGHGTTTLVGALNVLDGRVIGRCMARHRRRESSVSSMRSSARLWLATWSTPWPASDASPSEVIAAVGALPHAYHIAKSFASSSTFSWLRRGHRIPTATE